MGASRSGHALRRRRGCSAGPGLEASMRRLGVDRFDLAQVHDPDDHLGQAADETVLALIRLRDQA